MTVRDTGGAFGVGYMVFYLYFGDTFTSLRFGQYGLLPGAERWRNGAVPLLWGYFESRYALPQYDGASRSV